MTADDGCKKTTVRIMKLIRQYPYKHLIIGTRAALAFYEVLQTLIILKVRDPILTAALITLPHRIKNESVIENEKIIKETIGSLENPSATYRKIPDQHLNPSKTVQILRELDSLQDMIYALSYKVDILSPDWFKVAQISLFKAEAPVLIAQTLDEEKKADFTIYKKVLNDLQQRDLIRFQDGNIHLTRIGSFIKYKNILTYIERSYPLFSRIARNRLSYTEDDRKYQRGDKYKCLHIRRTLRNIIKKGRNNDQVSKEVLRVREILLKKNCVVVLALDHSWSMARSKNYSTQKTLQQD